MGPIRVGAKIELQDVCEDTAREMALVGVIPVDELDPIGHVFEIAGQPFKVYGYCTKEEFLQAVEAAGMDPVPFYAIPETFKFERISTD